MFFSRVNYLILFVLKVSVFNFYVNPHCALELKKRYENQIDKQDIFNMKTTNVYLIPIDALDTQ